MSDRLHGNYKIHDHVGGVTPGIISDMHWWQIPLFLAVAAWALYLYSRPSDKVIEDMRKLRRWWKSRSSRGV